MANTEREERERDGGKRMGFEALSDDLVQSILSRLPALDFAAASCVSRSWNGLSSRILSRPKLASALSLNPVPEDALREVLEKVLSEPIRPHFAIASVGTFLDLKTAHHLITKRLGPRVPVITCIPAGIIGRDALSGEFKEVQWEYDLDDIYEVEGVVLTVGFLPGIKVDVIPMSEPQRLKTSQESMATKFLMDIEDFTAVSRSKGPEAIIIFGDQYLDKTPILNTLDCALPAETAVVGDPCCKFLYQNGNGSSNVLGSSDYVDVAAALIFASDGKKSHGTGKTQFCFDLSTGLLPVGPLYKAASVRVNRAETSTWLTAKREGTNMILDGQGILDDMDNELGFHNWSSVLYVGVMERRKCKIGPNKVRLLTALAFHEVRDGDEQYLYVSGDGIKSGDIFQFYHSDSNVATSSCSNVSLNLKNYMEGVADENDSKIKKEVIGGFVFSCCGRGASFFGQSNVDSSPLTDNFAAAPVAGQFCRGEIGRCSSSCILGDNSEQSSGRCSLHVYSTVYLVISYTPPVSKG